MRVIRHETPRAFLDRAGGWLVQAEAENNLIFGVCGRLIAHPEGAEGNLWFLTVEEDSRVVGAAMMTPPNPLVLAGAPAKAIRALAEHLREAGAALPGVHGPPDDARAFAMTWARGAGRKTRLGRDQRIYACGRVEATAAAPGRLRPAAPDEQARMLEWGLRFSADVGMTDPPERIQKRIREMLADRRLFVWDDGGPACMAAQAGETPTGARITSVYTPPERRNRGYATACVAALTRRALESGRRFCFLYTDLDNPISNRIYARIGYRPVIDAQEWVFE
jgi:predicted GNAT family acetyltransferase